MLDFTSRSLLSERDVVDDDDNNKEIVKEEGHSRTVRIVEEMTEAGGARFNNKIVRKLVWEKRVMIVDTARWVGRNSRETEIFVFGSPMMKDIENAGVKRGVVVSSCRRCHQQKYWRRKRIKAS